VRGLPRQFRGEGGAVMRSEKQVQQ